MASFCILSKIVRATLLLVSTVEPVDFDSNCYLPGPLVGEALIIELLSLICNFELQNWSRHNGKLFYLSGSFGLLCVCCLYVCLALI